MKKYNESLYQWHAGRMLKRLLFSALYMAMLSLIALSCDEFVQVDMPKNQLLAANVFEEKGTADAAMSDVYARIRDVAPFTGSNLGMTMMLGAYADELDLYGVTSGIGGPFYQNSLTAANAEVGTAWNNAYGIIYGANAVLEGVTQAVKLQQEDKDRLAGEALFVRAFVHSHLAGIFGNVPYVNTTELEVNKRIGKKAAAEVYQLAIADLEQAISLLPEVYSSELRVRPNKYAAYALLSRLCLYAGRYDESSNAASAVLNNTSLYAYENNLDIVFKKESKGTLWQLAPKAAGGNSLQASAFHFTSGPPPLSAMTPGLVAAFEPGDQRLVKWVKKVTTAGNSWYQSYKYKQRTNTGTTVELSVMLRLGEVYLIRAEARARAGELIGAKEDLNVIRATASLGVTPAVTQGEILQAILKERRVELFTEYGHRFYDLKRFGQIDAVLGAVKPGWQSTDLVWPLPAVDMDLNPNLLPQNPGY